MDPWFHRRRSRLAAECDTAQLTLSGVIGQADMPVGEEVREHPPALEHVIHGLGDVGVPRQLGGIQVSKSRSNGATRSALDEPLRRWLAVDLPRPTDEPVKPRPVILEVARALADKKIAPITSAISRFNERYPFRRISKRDRAKILQLDASPFSCDRTGRIPKRPYGSRQQATSYNINFDAYFDRLPSKRQVVSGIDTGRINLRGQVHIPTFSRLQLSGAGDVLSKLARSIMIVIRHLSP